MFTITATLKFETDDLKEWEELLGEAQKSKEIGDIIRIKSGIRNNIYYVETIIKEGH